jgi:peptidoglycan/xylan/chitin deacetylase (PgdA/CDA1 family)
MKSVPVLMYHHVSPNPGLVTMSPENFEAHMAYLAGAGYRSIRADELAAFMEGRQTLKGKNVLITFDDGFLDNYVYAYPLLKRYGLHAVIFSVTGWIGDGPARDHLDSGKALPDTPDHKACKKAIADGRPDEVMMRWSEIEAMETDSTIEIHSHTHSHIRWDQQYPEQTSRLQALQDNLQLSRDTLQSRLGRSSRHLCWPWGYTEAGYADAARSVGYDVQYLTEKRANYAGGSVDAIGRIVAKEKPASWLASRLRIYSNRYLATAYTRLRGE